MLRKHGTVGKFVEFHGEGMTELSLADRAKIANMSPDYGATMGFFPIDRVSTIEAYLRANRMFVDYDELLILVPKLLPMEELLVKWHYIYVNVTRPQDIPYVYCVFYVTFVPLR